MGMKYECTVGNRVFTLEVKEWVYDRLIKYCPIDFDPETATDCVCCQEVNEDVDCELVGLFDMSVPSVNKQLNCHEAMNNLNDFYLQCMAYIGTLQNQNTIDAIVGSFSKKKDGTFCKNRTHYPVVCKNGRLYEDSYCHMSDALKWKVDGDCTATLSFDSFKHTW